jgi:hypothetical protein
VRRFPLTVPEKGYVGRADLRIDHLRWEARQGAR